MSDPAPTKYYFFDEAGDPTLFDAKGRVIAGSEGCSRHFILGMLDVADPEGLRRRMSELHGKILADPFFADIDSLKPERRKTALFFHAKDDVPEVRERVFRLLAAEDVRFYAVIRDKQGLATDVRNRNASSATYRYSPNKLYDELIKRLLKDRLHKSDAYQICFARRGRKDRTDALKSAVEAARENFRRKWSITSAAPIEVAAEDSHARWELQATDYFLWALQRLLSRGDRRYLAFLWSQVALIHDVDDREQHAFGRYHSGRKPMVLRGPEKEKARDIGLGPEGADHTA